MSFANMSPEDRAKLQLIIRIVLWAIFVTLFLCSGAFPESFWPDLAVTATALGLAALIIHAIALPSGRDKTVAAGAAVCGASYFFIIFNGLFFHSLYEDLPTSKMLAGAYRSIHIGYSDAKLKVFLSKYEDPSELYFRSSMMGVQTEDDPDLPVWPSTIQEIPLIPPHPPGYVSFFQAGHCAFAMIFAILGAAAAMLLTWQARLKTAPGMGPQQPQPYWGSPPQSYPPQPYPQQPYPQQPHPQKAYPQKAPPPPYEQQGWQQPPGAPPQQMQHTQAPSSPGPPPNGPSVGPPGGSQPGESQSTAPPPGETAPPQQPGPPLPPWAQQHPLDGPSGEKTPRKPDSDQPAGLAPNSDSPSDAEGQTNGG